MKLRASRIERIVAKVEATLVPPPREWLQVIIDDGDDEAEAKEKALAEHVARHPEDVGRTVEDFNWVLSVIVRPAGGRSCWCRCGSSHDASDGRCRQRFRTLWNIGSELPPHSGLMFAARTTLAHFSVSSAM